MASNVIGCAVYCDQACVYGACGIGGTFVVTSCSYMGHCTALKIFREPYKNGHTPEQLSEVYDTNVRVLEYLGPLQGLTARPMRTRRKLTQQTAALQGMAR